MWRTRENPKRVVINGSVLGPVPRVRWHSHGGETEGIPDYVIEEQKVTQANSPSVSRKVRYLYCVADTQQHIGSCSGRVLEPHGTTLLGSMTDAETGASEQRK